MIYIKASVLNMVIFRLTLPRKFFVRSLRLERRTPALKVLCSSNWAMSALKVGNIARFTKYATVTVNYAKESNLSFLCLIPTFVGCERLELPMNLISWFTVSPDAISGHQPNSKKIFKLSF